MAETDLNKQPGGNRCVKEQVTRNKERPKNQSETETMRSNIWRVQRTNTMWLKNKKKKVGIYIYIYIYVQ